MIPGTWATVLITLAAVPGYLYLSLTKNYRRPGQQTSLEELLEVLLVSAATTGASLLVLILLAPTLTHDTLTTFGTPVAHITPARLRQAAELGFALLACSLLLSWGMARITRWRAMEHFSPSVVQATLGLKKKGAVTAVSLGLKDGSTVEGVLHAYTLDDEQDTRTIALKSPIRYIAAGDQRPTDLTVDYALFFSDEIRRVLMRHVPDPPVSAAGGSSPQDR